MPDIVRQLSAVGYERTVGRGTVINYQGAVGYQGTVGPGSYLVPNEGTIGRGGLIMNEGTIGRQNSYLNTVGRRTSASM